MSSYKAKNWIRQDELRKIQRQYSRPSLRRRQLHANPARQFIHWFHQAVKSGCSSPDAMVLSSMKLKKRPSSRVVLLKHVDAGGMVFFTSYESPKAYEFKRNPYVSVLFFWSELERQVRICGLIKKISKKESDEYFATRPREAQIGAWIGRQSSPIVSRTELERKYHFLTRRHQGKPVPRPPSWGGFRIAPESYEFWQGGRHRLNDRFHYQKMRNGRWKISRLMP